MTPVSVSGLKKSFTEAGKTREVLRGVELSVADGELLSIVGASGSGKTTLLNILGALDGRFDGQVSIYGKGLRGLGDDQRARLRAETIGFVFQSYHLLEHLSVIENVQVPLWLAGGRDATEERQRALSALESVGLSDRADSRVPPLSGGERQRVAIARAIVNQPRLVLADEPTGNLDRETGRTIYQLFDEIRRSGDQHPAVVVVTHDAELAKRADRALTLQEGRLSPSEPA